MATEYVQYTVQIGDTLWGISRTYGVTVDQIKQLNGLTSDTIYPGQVLKIKEAPPSGNYVLYTVVSGDTLWGISRKYGVTVDQLKQLNGLTSDTIYPNQVLKIKEAPPSVNYVLYTVVSGDTLWGISRKYGVTVDQIKQLNSLTSDTIYPGQVLKIKEVVPAEEYITYTVVSGDTLWAISRKYGVTVDQIKQLNGLSSDTIYPGQVLKIKKTTTTPPPGPSQLITHGNLQRTQIALTFDAGSDIAGIGILDVLKKHNVKSTFFLTGTWVEKFPSYAQRIAAEGHEIGNHSYSHPYFTQITYAAMLDEIKKAEAAILQRTGKNPRPYFRFPYGASNAEALKAVGEAGYPFSIQWTHDTIDWQQPAADVIVSRIESNASNGDIFLMHIGGINTPEAVDRVIPILKAKGFQLVTISQILA